MKLTGDAKTLLDWRRFCRRKGLYDFDLIRQAIIPVVVPLNKDLEIVRRALRPYALLLSFVGIFLVAGTAAYETGYKESVKDDLEKLNFALLDYKQQLNADSIKDEVEELRSLTVNPPGFEIRPLRDTRRTVKQLSRASDRLKRIEQAVPSTTLKRFLAKQVADNATLQDTLGKQVADLERIQEEKRREGETEREGGEKGGTRDGGPPKYDSGDVFLLQLAKTYDNIAPGPNVVSATDEKLFDAFQDVVEEKERDSAVTTFVSYTLCLIGLVFGIVGLFAGVKGEESVA